MSTYPLHDFSKFPLYPDFPQPPTDFSASQKLDIGEIKYEAPNFVSTHATPKLLADALEREFQNLDFRDGVECPDLMAPETEITVPVMTVKSQATDEAGLARDAAAEVKRELVKSANSFARFHRMNYEKTGEWPEWYNERWAPVYREAVLWEAEFVEHVDPFAALPPDLRGEDGKYGEDRSDMLLAQMMILAGDADKLGLLKRAMAWDDEDLDRMLPELGLRKWRQEQAKEAGQEPQEAGLLDKIAEAAKEGLEQVLDALGPEEAGAQELGTEDLESSEGLNEAVMEQTEVSKPTTEEQTTNKELQAGGRQDINDTSGAEPLNEHRENIVDSLRLTKPKVTKAEFIKMYNENKDTLNLELEKLWNESIPDGEPPREQGGFFIRNPDTGKVSLMRLPGGEPYVPGAETLGMKFPKNIPENAIGTIHTHPIDDSLPGGTPRKPAPSKEDVQMSKEMGIPGIVFNPNGLKVFDKNDDDV